MNCYTFTCMSSIIKLVHWTPLPYNLFQVIRYQVSISGMAMKYRYCSYLSFMTASCNFLVRQLSNLYKESGKLPDYYRLETHIIQSAARAAKDLRWQIAFPYTIFQQIYHPQNYRMLLGKTNRMLKSYQFHTCMETYVVIFTRTYHLITR